MQAYKFIIGLFISLLIFGSCEKVKEVQQIIVHKTAREKYIDSLQLATAADTLQYEQWQMQWDSAITQDLHLILPYQEKGYILNHESPTNAYPFDLRIGEKLNITFTKDSQSVPVLLELLVQENDSLNTWTSIWSNDEDELHKYYEPQKDARYLLRWQAAMNSQSAYELRVWNESLYDFPVMGRDNEDVWSFFGDDRDAGKRKHKGVDVFARRGTPLIAITDGKVTSSKNEGLGGKQVWLRDIERGYSLYYAHLDSQFVATGDYLEAGDTLGWVGNTGNASRTRPHLHFGIYKRGWGAIDPLPFIKKRKLNFRESSTPILAEKQSAFTNINSTNLRKGPNNKCAIITALKKGTVLHMEAVVGQWLRVQTMDGIHGFVFGRSVKVLEEEPS